MSSKVLIAYDGSPQGEDALRFGRRIAEVLDASPVVTMVIAHPRHGTDEREFENALNEYCGPFFAKAQESMDGIEVKPAPVVNDSPAAGIYEMADWEKPSVIVIGSTRHGKAGHVQVGTVGGSLLSGVPCSVAVAPRGYTNGEARLARIGVAVDGGSEAWRALTAASNLAEKADAKLRILSVTGEPHYVLGGLLSPLNPEEYRAFKEKEWERLYEDAAGRVADTVDTEPQLLHGDPAEALSEAARDLDLLILGSRAYGPIKGTVLGSVSARVMAAASTPVLVVPRGAGPTPFEA